MTSGGNWQFVFLSKEGVGASGAAGHGGRTGDRRKRSPEPVRQAAGSTRRPSMPVNIVHELCMGGVRGVWGICVCGVRVYVCTWAGLCVLARGGQLRGVNVSYGAARVKEGDRMKRGSEGFF